MIRTQHINVNLSVAVPEDGEEHEAMAHMLQSECVDQFPADRNGTRRFSMTLFWTVALLAPPRRRPLGSGSIDWLQREFDEAVGWYRREPGIDTIAAVTLAMRNLEDGREG